MRSTFKKYIALIVLCSLFFVFGLLRVSDRNLLTPDSCQYIIWGNSLAHVQGYVDNTTPEPDRFINHGPLYSLLIAPVELIFPLPVPAVKVWTLLFVVTSILLFYFLLLQFFNQTTAIIATALFAFNPLLLLYSTEVLSDVPFLAAVLASFLFYFKHHEKPGKQKLHFALLILSIITVVLLREIGLSLVAVIVLMFFLNRDWKRALIIGGSVLLVLGLWNIRNNMLVGKTVFSQTGNSPWVFEHIMTAPDTTFLNELIVRYWHNLKAYSDFLFGMMFYPTFATHQLSTIFNEASRLYQIIKLFFEVGKYIVFIATLPLFIIGIAKTLHYSKTPSLQNNYSPSRPLTPAPLFLFIPTYLLVLCIFPFNDMRYMFPLVPFVLFFCLIGLKRLAELTSKEIFNRTSIAVAFSILLIIPNAMSISEMIRHNIRSNNSNALPWSEMGKWIQQNTPDHSVIASPLKDLALFTGGERKVFLLYPNIEVPRFEFSLRDNQAAYLLSPHSYEDATMFEMNMLESSRFTFEHVHTEGNLHLYKIISLLKEPSREKFNVANTISISGHLVSARRLLLKEEYTNAQTILDSIIVHAPTRPDVLFQQVVCSAMKENIEQAEQYYQRLTALPSDVGIYIQPAQRHLEILRLLNEALTTSSEELRSVKLLKVTSAYWNLGYYNRASSLMNSLLADSSEYFEGLLWGTHFALQRGDIGKAQQFHQRLWEIDSLNTLARSYKNILSLKNSMMNDTSRISLSKHHATIAKMYQMMGLREEALDETERSLGMNTDNREVQKLFTSIRRKK